MEDVLREKIAAFKRATDGLKAEIGKVIVGQTPIVDAVITAMVAGGHVLLEGVPGLGKTKLVSTLAKALSLKFSRIQFTPDLMPSDITGTKVALQNESGHTHLDFQKGPIFANVVLADEINRATPRTQSAMLEAMQERSVTVGRTTYTLADPFFVMATQNPLEMDGTYPLPEAQLDRFLFKLHMPFPSHEDLHAILDRTTGAQDPQVHSALAREEVMQLRTIAMDVPVARHVQDFAIRIVEGTHPDRDMAPETTRRYIRFGASPRGAQSLIIAAKVRSVLDGRFAVSTDDIRNIAKPALRHRIIRNFEAEAEGVNTDTILEEILATVRVE